MDGQQFGYTRCTDCGRLVIVVVGSKPGEWQYLCICGSAFEFEQESP